MKPDFVYAALSYAAQRALAEDWTNLRDLGLDSQAAAALVDLTVAELRELAQRADQQPILEVRFSQRALQYWLEQVQRHRAEEVVLRELVRADAPRPMLMALCGLSYHSTWLYRRQLGVKSTGYHRPPTLPRRRKPRRRRPGATV